MSKKRNNIVNDLLGKPVPRRQALQGIGAMAIAGPVAAACSSDEGSPPSPGTGGVPGSGGSAATTGGVTNTGGTSPATGGTSPATGGTSPATGGAAPQATGGTSEGGTSGGTPATGGSSTGGVESKGGAGAGGTSGGAGGAQGGAGGGGGGALVVPPWDAVNMCVASKTDGAGQGPFFIHELEKDDDISMIRQDIRGQYNPMAEPGIEMQLHLRILSSKGDCMPVPDAEVYIWHTDAQGYYSGFGNPGDQAPDMPYAGVPSAMDLDNTDRFCRGIQITGADGVVSFRSYYPGWYNGRDLHIHLVVLKRGSMSMGRTNYSGANHLFTTQFYFDPAFSDMIHKSAEPYKRRTMIGAYTGAIAADENGNSGLRSKATLESGIVVAQMQVMLDPKA